MKRFTPIITFFAGCGVMLLISAKNQSTPAVEIPRYYISWHGVYDNGILYDAVTGDYKDVSYRSDFMKRQGKKSLKALLEEPGK